MENAKKSSRATLPTTSATRIALVVVMGNFLMVLDATVMNVTIPVLQAYFSEAASAPVPYSLISWTVTGYTLAQAVAIPLTDWIARRWGAARFYIVALSLFTITSLACAAAPTLGILIAMRVFQGAAGGCLMPLGVTMVARAAGPERLGRYMSVMGVPMMLAPVLGPVVGGWLLQFASWRWIFLINIPVGIAGVIASIRVLPRDIHSARVSLDVIGIALLCPGLALTLWGISLMGSAATFVDVRVVVPVVGGMAAIALFAWRSFHILHPLLDLSVLAIRGFRRAVAVMLCYQMGYFGAMLLIPSYLQQVRGLTPIETGMLMMPAGLASMVAMPLATRLVDKVPFGRIVPWGVALLGLSIVAFTRATPDTPVVMVGFVLTLQGCGLGLTFMPTATGSLKPIPADAVGSANTVWNILNQIGSAVGVACVSVFLAINVARYPSAKDVVGNGTGAVPTADAVSQASAAFAHTFWMPVVILGVGVLCALRLPVRKGDIG